MGGLKTKGSQLCGRGAEVQAWYRRRTRACLKFIEIAPHMIQFCLSARPGQAGQLEASLLQTGSANKRGPKECSRKTSLAYSLWTSRSLPACRALYSLYTKQKKNKNVRANKKATNSNLKKNISSSSTTNSSVQKQQVNQILFNELARTFDPQTQGSSSSTSSR